MNWLAFPQHIRPAEYNTYTVKEIEDARKYAEFQLDQDTSDAAPAVVQHWRFLVSHSNEQFRDHLCRLRIVELEGLIKLHDRMIENAEDELGSLKKIIKSVSK